MVCFVAQMYCNVITEGIKSQYRQLCVTVCNQIDAVIESLTYTNIAIPLPL